MKKLFTLLLAVLLVLGLAGCSSNSGSSDSTSNESKEVVVKVAATPNPHADILNDVVKGILAEKGITLEVVEYTDYVQPNTVVEDGTVLLNYFQHVPYLEDFNAKNGTHIVSVAGVHVEPMGLYLGKANSIDDLKAGATVAVPYDTTNEARALKLLADNGYITLPEGADTTATAKDIVDNPYNIKIQEVEAAQLPNVLQDVDFAIINGNYAIQADLNPTKDAILLEGSSSAYVNVLCCKEGNENDPLVKAVVAALTSQQVGDYIAEKYQDGSVVFAVDNPTDGYDSSIDYDALTK